MTKQMILLGVVLAMGFLTQPVSADGLPFAVTPQPMKAQLDKKAHYYDLQTHPGEVVALKMQIKNLTQTAKTVRMIPEPARTNQLGNVVYDRTVGQAINPRLGFDKLATSTQRIKLSAGQTRRLTVKVRLPKTMGNGVVAGGLHFQEVTAQRQHSHQQMLANRYAYVLGVVLHTGQTKKVVKVNLQARAVGHQIGIGIRNKANQFVNQVKVTQTVKDDRGHVVHQAAVQGKQLAPNVTAAMTLDQQTYQPGDYQVTTRFVSKTLHQTVTNNVKVK